MCVPPKVGLLSSRKRRFARLRAVTDAVIPSENPRLKVKSTVACPGRCAGAALEPSVNPEP